MVRSFAGQEVRKEYRRSVASAFKILSLRVKDRTILDDFMKINLIKRKNDQYRNGHISVLAMSRKPTCPVGITEDFFLCSPIPRTPVIKLFVGLLNLNSSRNSTSP